MEAQQPSDVYEELRQLIGSETRANVGPLAPQLRLEELGLDSLSRIRVVIGIERKYGVDIDEETARKLETVNDLVQLIQSRENRR